MRESLRSDTLGLSREEIEALEKAKKLRYSRCDKATRGPARRLLDQQRGRAQALAIAGVKKVDKRLAQTARMAGNIAKVFYCDVCDYAAGNERKHEQALGV
jgi:hypothetical protein